MAINPLHSLPLGSYPSLQSDPYPAPEAALPFVNIALTTGLVTANVYGVENLKALRLQLQAAIQDVDRVLVEGYGIDPATVHPDPVEA